MTLDFALQGILPLIVFAVVDIFAGMRKAIIAALVFALLEAAWSWHRFGEVDQITWISLGLIFAMGLISIKMKDDRLFKFQPVAMAVVFAVTMAWFQWRGDPLLLQMMPKVASLLPPDRQWMLKDETIIKSMAQLDLIMIAVFISHGALIAWAALRKSTLVWIVARGVGFYGLMAIGLVVNFMFPPQ